MATFISAIVLAAGESKRMGQPKLFLPWGPATILEQTVANFLSAKADEVILVVGEQSERALRLLRNCPVKVVVNPDYASGMASSIVIGLGQVAGQSQAIMLALADQPLVDPPTINQLVEAFSEHKKGIVVPVYQGRRGHPVLFSLKYRQELSELKGDTGAREIVARHTDDVLEVAVDNDGVLVDIDTPAAYQEYKGKSEA